MLVFLYAGVKIINRIEELRIDMLQEDKANNDALEMKREANFIWLQCDINEIKAILNKPLYEVGNTVWYNMGNDGSGGVFEDLKGKIISIEPSCSEPCYKVLGRGGVETSVHQSFINAWTN
jgi:hypothetical protein